LKNNVIDKGSRANASKGHLKVLEIIKAIYPYQITYQEYPYSNILKASYKKRKIKNAHQYNYYLYRGTTLFADIFVYSLNVIVEVNGQQHYEPILWSNEITIEQARLNFATQQHNDRIKKNIAKEAEATMIIVPYTDLKNVDEAYILERIQNEI